MDIYCKQNGKYVFLILVLSFVSLTSWFICINQKTEAANNTNVKSAVGIELLHGGVSQNELIDNLERLGIKCIIHEGAGASGVRTLSIDKVRLGSSAFYGGMLAGDLIKDLHKLNANAFSLSIERSGKFYRVNLEVNVNNGDLSTQTNEKKTNVDIGIQKLIIPGSVSKQDSTPAKKLLPYDIELIIDVSGSMKDVDGTGDLTKFGWCYEQVRTLAKQLAGYRKTFTITTFNNTYQTIKRCEPETVGQIYGTVYPCGGTDLLDPLMDRLNNTLETYRRDGNPVLIVVITDGLPNIPSDPRVVKKALIDFSQKLNKPDQVIVTLLQIGDTFDGREFCIDLDDNLVKEGAKYDIVDTKTFAQLKQEGLVNAMVDAITEARNNRNLSRQEKHFKYLMKSLPAPSQKIDDYDHELKKRQSERHEIERQILGQ